MIYFVFTNNSLISTIPTSSTLAISNSVWREGCISLVHHLDTEVSVLPNWFANSLLVIRSLLSKMIKTADSEIAWKGSSPCHLLYFSEKMKELMKATFSIISLHNYNHEVVLKRQDNDPIWSLTEYQHYCSGHIRYTPWHFFPRYLSKKEFLDPYNALEKFTQYQTVTKWKYTLKELLHHALSPTGINEFNGSTGILHMYTLLHKLIEAAPLIAIRMDPEPAKPNKLKWKDKKEETKPEEES